MASTLDPLPQDIWWLVCQELTAHRDFNSLFTFARTSQSMAQLALPLLYSIHELASASADDASVGGKAKLAALWRAIILSSIGKTVYPYCLWIKNLKLGNLKELLSDIAPYPHLRDAFFHGEMASFNIMDDRLGPAKSTRHNRPRLNIQGISTKAGETITTFVKDAADRENKAVALTHLEGEYIPMDILPTWTSRLSTLVSLNIRDGSVIGPQVAAAIRDNCPKFRELECYFCDGPTVDEDVASFFLTLPQNSLEAFSVSSKNRLGKQALEALGHHSTSLKKLGLSGLQSPAFAHLHSLAGCTALRSLTLEAEKLVTVSWESEHKDSFLEVLSWLRQCSSLTHLKLWQVPSATALLAEVLKAPQVRLTALDLKLVDDNDLFYSSLGHQTSLENFSMRRSGDELLELAPTQHAQFVSSVCKCKSLRVLDLMQMMLTLDDVADLALSLPLIEDFSFSGELFDDTIWGPLSGMRNMRILNVNANTVFTFDGVMGFIHQLGTSEPPRDGFGLFIMNQSAFAKFSPKEEQLLVQRIQSTVGGSLDILYPEEEHESDFSD